jgi:hypothetical protein
MFKAILTLRLFLLSYVTMFAQQDIPTFKGKSNPEVWEEIHRQQQEREMTDHNRSLKPEGLSDRFGDIGDRNDLFISNQMNSATDEEKRALLRKHYGYSAERKFNNVFSNWTLLLLALTLLVTYLQQKKQSIQIALTGAALSLVAYLLFSFIGGDADDFQLMVERTWPLALLVIAGIGASNFLFSRLLTKSNTLELGQRIVLLLGITIASSMVTYYLSSYGYRDLQDVPFFDLDEHKMN